MPSRALKAGSTCPPLAESTAFTTVASMDGKASLRVASACSRGLIGRGGLGGGASSFGGGLGAETPLLSPAGFVSPSWSLSKSSGLAVVGDSPPSEGFKGDTGDACTVSMTVSWFSRRQAYGLVNVGHYDFLCELSWFLAVGVTEVPVARISA